MRHRRLVWSRLAVLLLFLTLFLAGCTPGADNGQPTTPAAPSVRTEQQAMSHLLTLYQEAVLAEDSDRLAALLVPTDVRAQVQTAVCFGLSSAPLSLILSCHYG